MMKNKINIAELLKDCPKGMELDCLLYDNVTFERFDVEQNRCYFKAGPADTFWTTCYGKINGSPFGKCIIFPKGKTTWEGFTPPYEFKDGDVLSYQYKGYKNRTIYIYMQHSRMNTTYYVALSGDSDSRFMVNDKEGHALNSYDDSVRLATAEEKEKLFQAIKDNGYHWNEKTKTLEKLVEPKFKDGDRVVKKGDISTPASIVRISDEYYFYYSNTEGTIGLLPIAEQDDWELAPNKFDITALKPFDKVLMRSSNAREWVGTFYSHYSNNKFYGCGMCCDQCVPYEKNEHLLGKTDDCDEYFKTW